jgi:hypothetical protein
MEKFFNQLGVNLISVVLIVVSVYWRFAGVIIGNIVFIPYGLWKNFLFQAYIMKRFIKRPFNTSKSTLKTF